jgi:alpha-mannosidase
VVVTAVKLADDGSGDVVVRFHEAHGGRATATLTPDFEVASATVTDLLERPLPDAPAPRSENGRLVLPLGPFELVTLRLKRA